MRILDFNGVASISRNAETVYQNFTEPFTQHTPFCIGSLSKQITAVLILKAIELQLLELHTPIGSYLSYLDAQFARTVTTHHLLTHTSGISDPSKPPLFTPGSCFVYSNAGYYLLGALLVQVHKESYEKLVSKLFMTLSSTNNTQGGVITHYKNPAGGVISTVEDLHMWNRSLHSGLLLDEQSYKKLTTAYTTRKHRWGTIGYGYGLQIGNKNRFQEYSHNGLVPGYASTLLYYPELSLSVVILESLEWPATNDEDPFGEAAQRKIFASHDQLRDQITFF